MLDTGIPAPAQQFCQVTPVMPAGIGRQAALCLQVVQETIDPVPGFVSHCQQGITGGIRYAAP
jgi:hypothetical protein